MTVLFHKALSSFICSETETQRQATKGASLEKHEEITMSIFVSLYRNEGQNCRMKVTNKWLRERGFDKNMQK